MLDSIYLNVSGKCNLRCVYCFANHGNYEEEEGLMSVQTAQKAIDLLFQGQKKGKVKNIVFFGGEPLLNWKVIEFSANYAIKLAKRQKQSIFFSMTTNGTLFTKENVAFMNKHRVSLLVSIDSQIKTINDKLRPSKNGQSTIRQILKGLSLFKPADNISIRATLTEENQNIIGYLKCFRKYKFIRSIIYAPKISYGAPLGKKDPHDIYNINIYKSTAEKYLQYLFKNWEDNNIIKPDVFEDEISSLQIKNNKPAPSSIICAAGKSQAAVSPKGDLYYCLMHIGEKRHVLGNVNDGLDKEKQRAFLKENRFDKKTKCRACEVKNICRGGCPSEHFRATGRFDSPSDDYCDFIKLKLNYAQRIVNKIDNLLNA